MAKRNCRFEVRLTKDEYTDLTRKARKAGLSTSTFVRMSVAGQEIHEAPTADVSMLLQEIRRCGQDLKQLMSDAKGKGMPEANEIRKALESNRAMEKMIAAAYGF